MDTPEGAAPRSRDDRGRRLRAGLVAAGAAVGLTLAGLGVSAAQTDGQGTTPPAEAEAPGQEHDVFAAPPPGFGFHRGPGKGMRMFGMGMGIHGETTTKAPDGGYQTLANQLGEVTEVSRSSVTVKSEDGFSRTYTVDDNTLVNAGNDGIGDVKSGDDVLVVALVKDGKASAVDVHDATRVRQLHERWMPRPQIKPAPPAGEGTGSGG